MSVQRLQKVLAQAGLGSRRTCEQLIADGRVTVNGRTATLGESADLERDHISVDGKRVRAAQALRYYALNKPAYVISAAVSHDGRPTVRDLVPVANRLYPVGRLDFESEGLVLLTNDGELTNRITHPRYGCEKEYRALVGRQPDDRQIKAWRAGVVLEDGYRTAPAEVRVEGRAKEGVWLRIVMHEGRKRQIREIGERLGLAVFRLQRVRIGSLGLGHLKLGEWRELTKAEVAALKKLSE